MLQCRDLFLYVGFLSPPMSEEEVYTRSLPLTSCQEDRLGLDYTVLRYG